MRQGVNCGQSLKRVCRTPVFDDHPIPDPVDVHALYYDALVCWPDTLLCSGMGSPCCDSAYDQIVLGNLLFDGHLEIRVSGSRPCNVPLHLVDQGWCDEFRDPVKISRVDHSLDELTGNKFYRSVGHRWLPPLPAVSGHQIASKRRGTCIQPAARHSGRNQTLASVRIHSDR
jgi:hypothetical protein